jgi:Mg-chelatase subunit ChlD
MNCPHCNAPNPPTSTFCSKCGLTLAATIAQGRTVAMPAPGMPPPQAPGLAAGAGQAPVGPAAALAARTQRAHNILRQSASRHALPGLAPSAQRELVFLIDDVSGSMAESCEGNLTKLEAVQQANVAMIAQKARLDPNDEMGLIAFDHAAQVVFSMTPLAQGKVQLIRAVQELHIQGGTDLNQGLKAARESFAWPRPAVVRRIVLLTDGQGGDPLHTAKELKDSGVVIDVVGVGPDPAQIDEPLLKKVASLVQGQLHYRFIKDSRTLTSHYTALAGKTRIGP